MSYYFHSTLILTYIYYTVNIQQSVHVVMIPKKSWPYMGTWQFQSIYMGISYYHVPLSLKTWIVHRLCFRVRFILYILLLFTIIISFNFIFFFHGSLLLYIFFLMYIYKLKYSQVRSCLIHFNINFIKINVVIFFNNNII